MCFAMSSVYHINKGVSRPLVFKGLKAQYIAVLALGLVALLLTFAGGYFAGVPLAVLLPLTLGLGSALFFAVYRLSRRFGEHGLLKHLAARRLPRFVKFRSRRIFTGLLKR